MVTLRDRSTIKRPLKLRDAAEGDAATSEEPTAKRQKKVLATTQGARMSTTSTKPKSSKSRQVAGERSKKRNARAETLAKKAKGRGKKDDPTSAPAAAPVATTAALAANNTSTKSKKEPESKGKTMATEPESASPTTATAANEAAGKDKEKQSNNKTKSKSTEPGAIPATTSTSNNTTSKVKEEKPERKAKTKSTEPEPAPATVANTQSRGKKRKPEADAPESEKEDDSSADRAEAGKKPGRPRKRQAVQDVRETDEQSSQQEDAPQSEPGAGRRPTKSHNRRQPSQKKPVGDVKTSRNGRMPLTEASDSLKAQQATKQTEPQPEEHKSTRVRSVTAGPSKTLDDGRGAVTQRTKIILKMPTAPQPRRQRTPEIVPELPIAEPEVPELKEQAQRHRPVAVASPSPVSNPIDSRIAQATEEAEEEAEAEAELDPAVAGNRSPAKERKSARANARRPKATQTAEEEEVPKLSALAQAKFDSIRDFKVASFRGGAPGKPDPNLNLPRVKKNKPVSAAEEVRRTERWARSFLQEQNQDESPAAADVWHEILLERAKMCPRSKLAARRFKARLRDWAIKNGIQPALVDVAVDEAVEQARGEQHAFLELTKDSRRDLDKLDE